MFKKLFVPGVALGLSAFVFNGCAPSQTVQALTKIGDIIMDPSLPVGSESEQPSEAQITVYADTNANRSEYGDAPVDVWVFQLVDPDALNNADFISLMENPESTLSTSYVRHIRKQVKPGESTSLVPFKLTENTNYIGVAVAYANMDTASWRAVERVSGLGERYSILIPITKKGVTVQVHR